MLAKFLNAALQTGISREGAVRESLRSRSGSTGDKLLPITARYGRDRRLSMVSPAVAAVAHKTLLA